MEKKKISAILVLITLITIVFIQFVYAANLCPKGKECTFRGCGRYSDSNGNSLCDVAEGISASSPSGDSQGPPEVLSQGNTDTTENNSQSESISQSESSIDSEESASFDQEMIQEEDETLSLEQEISNPSEDTASTPLEYVIQFAKNNLLILAYAMFLIVAAFLYKLNIKRAARDRIRLFLLALSLGTLGFYFGGCICPIGALQNLPLKLAGVASGQYVLWLILMLLPIVFIFIAGRIFCSSVCPLGAVQELTFQIGKKLGLNHGRPGLERIKWLRYIKYAVLVWLVVFTAITGYTLFCRYDPFLTLFTFSGSLISILLLAAVLISSLLISRPWCRIICPYGALLGIINKISGREEDIKCSSCNGCGMCTRECPVDAISIPKDRSGNRVPEIDYLECINCKKCQ